MKKCMTHRRLVAGGVGGLFVLVIVGVGIADIECDPADQHGSLPSELSLFSIPRESYEAICSVDLRELGLGGRVGNSRPESIMKWIVEPLVGERGAGGSRFSGPNVVRLPASSPVLGVQWDVSSGSIDYINLTIVTEALSETIIEQNVHNRLKQGLIAIRDRLDLQENGGGVAYLLQFGGPRERAAYEWHLFSAGSHLLVAHRGRGVGDESEISEQIASVLKRLVLSRKWATTIYSIFARS
jgi:hypothetical protein